MINNTKKPAIFLTGVPSEFAFSVGDALDTQGAKANGYLLVGSATAGETLVIEFAGKSMEFIFGFIDFDNPLTLTNYTTGSFPSFIGRMAVELARHPVLSQYFTITHISASQYIWFQAKGRGTDYNITIGASTTATISYGGSAGSDDVLYSTTKVALRLVDEDDVAIEELKADALVNADEDRMVATFNETPAVLLTHVLTTDKYPLPIEITKPFATNKYGTFDLEVYSTKDDIISRKFTTRNNDFSIAGLSSPQYYVKAGYAVPDKGDAAALFLANYLSDTGRKFLTHQQRSKLIREEQPEWLSFIFKNTGSFKLRFTIQYIGASTAVYDVDFTVSEIGLYHLPVGVSQQSLNDVTPGENIWKYTVEVYRVSSTSIISEAMEYVNDTRYFEHPRYIIFENSLGGVDTLCTTGERLPETKYTRQTTEQVRTSATRTADYAMQMSLNEAEEMFTLFTGHLLEQADTLWLKDLLLSREVAEITELALPSGSYLYKQPMRKCIVLQESSADPADADFLYGREIKMKYAGKEQYVQDNGELEVYYDSFVEVLVEVTDRTSGSDLRISYVGTNVRFFMNDTLKNFAAGKELISTTGNYVLRVEGRNLTSLVFSSHNCTSRFVVREYQSRTITVFAITATAEIRMDYLTERPSRFRFITDATFGATDAEGLEALLVFFAKVYQRYGQLATLDLSGYTQTPTTMGDAAKTYLTGAGVTVTTN